jgi:DNA-directed RNA polymerase subunit F
MSGRKINEKSVSIPEVKEIMENVKEHLMEIESSEEEAMSHFQEITYQYVNKFSRMSAKAAIKIKNLLMEKHEIEEIYAINIVNVDPESVPELRTILEKSSVGKTLKDEKLQEILYQIQELKTS